ncbi:nucleotidyltransferase family protein, partial [bacterium]|nr:nucleotidyltransferase family protein [bacterium]
EWKVLMISAVVLAAGESRRMGKKKEALPIKGTPMIRLVVDELLASSKIDEVIVVLGAHADEVGLALSGIIDERLELVGNMRFSEGMGTSLAQGVSACSWGTDGILVALGDAPFFRAEDVNRLIDSHAHGAAIVVPVNAGRRGHPVLLDGSYRDELEDLSGDAGARHIIEHNADRTVEVAIDDDGFLVDVDEADDYEAVKNGIDGK